MFVCKALVVCDNERMVEACSRSLVEFGISLLQCGDEASSIINMILNNTPDFLVIDTSSAKVNPSEILKSVSLSSMLKKPMLLISIDEEDVFAINELKNSGTFHVISTPLTAPSLASTLIEYSQLLATMAESLTIPANRIETAVSEIIHNIGVPANIKGYYFLRSAVVMCVNDYNNLHSVTKRLYPEVAKMYNTTAARVERAIRHSIEVTWNRGNVDAIHILFGFRPGVHMKPTNSEFIAIITDNIRVKMKMTI